MNDSSSKESLYTYLSFVDTHRSKRGDSLKPPLSIRFIRALLFFIPDSSPEQKKLFWTVRSWKIEIDLSNKWTSREIGYDPSGKAIVCAPLRKDLGMWTDLDMTLKDYDRFNPTVITREEFEEDWKKLNP